MTSYFLNSLLPRSPLLLVVLAGIIFSIVRWRRHPKVSLITLIGLALYLGKVLLFTTLSYSVPRIRETMHLSYAATNNIFEVLSVLNDFTLAAIIILLVAAAFTSRQPIVATNS